MNSVHLVSGVGTICWSADTIARCADTSPEQLTYNISTMIGHDMMTTDTYKSHDLKFIAQTTDLILRLLKPDWRSLAHLTSYPSLLESAMTRLLTDVDIFIYQKYFVVFECVTNRCLIGDGLNVVVSPPGLILEPESTKLSSVTDAITPFYLYI